jgi:precorrin-6A synthase
VRKLLVIGIGVGNPEQITIEAIRALNRADVFFVVDKGREKADLARIRRAICDRYVERSDYRVVSIPDAERDRSPADYLAEVEAWRERRARLWGEAIRGELREGGCGAFLVWGDPSLYDGTIAVLERLRADGRIGLDYEVVPGITSAQALAAKHRITLSRAGGAVQITTGRRLAAAGLPGEAEDVVVMLDGACAFERVDQDDVEVYWGANLGTEGEHLLAGELAEVADEIGRLREEARRVSGWVMDTYLLRRKRREEGGPR